MSGSKREQHKAEVKRRRVRALLRDGYSASAICKITGYSYPHVKNLVEQEKDDLEREQ